MTEYGIIFVTVDTQETAQAIATELVSDRLVACVNLFPIHSVYIWDGKLAQTAEWQLVMKTDLSLFGAIEAKLQTLHPYDVPEILAIPIIQGSAPYLQWVKDQTTQF